MDLRLWRGVATLFLLARLAAPAVGDSGELAACARVSVLDSILPPPRDSCSEAESPIGVVEGDEAALQRALNLVYKNKEDDVTGVKPASRDPTSTERASDTLNLPEPEETTEQENCPFSWARSPEKLLQQDTYLALASSFVLLRLLYFLIPKLKSCIERAWRRHMQYATLMSFWDYFDAYLHQAKQGLNRLNPCKPSNLQEGAMNAKAWASKSLASVSIGDSPSSSRAQSTS